MRKFVWGGGWWKIGRAFGKLFQKYVRKGWTTGCKYEVKLSRFLLLDFWDVWEM